MIRKSISFSGGETLVAHLAWRQCHPQHVFFLWFEATYLINSLPMINSLPQGRLFNPPPPATWHFWFQCHIANTWYDTTWQTLTWSPSMEVETQDKIASFVVFLFKYSLWLPFDDVYIRCYACEDLPIGWIYWWLKVVVVVPLFIYSSPHALF